MFFDRKSAIKTFYYLIAVDGEISSEEHSKFNEIALQIDPEGFSEYKDSLIEECEAQMGNVIDAEDYVDVILEGINKAVMDSSSDRELWVPTRLVIWNLLAIAYADNNYGDEERKLIKHVVRLMELDKSVFLEFESMIKTAISVDDELTWLNSSDRPYAEIRPMVDEIEKRRKEIQESAQALIEDEILFRPEDEFKHPNKFEENRDKVINKSKEYIGIAGDKTKEFADVAGEKTKEFAGVAGEKTKEFAGVASEKGKQFAGVVGTKSKEVFGGIKSKFGKKKED